MDGWGRSGPLCFYMTNVVFSFLYSYFPVCFPSLYFGLPCSLDRVASRGPGLYTITPGGGFLVVFLISKILFIMRERVSLFIQCGVDDMNRTAHLGKDNWFRISQNNTTESVHQVQKKMG